METNIRQENQNDRDSVFKVVEAAFKGVEHSDGTEQFLVERLRESEAFVPELSLVAEAGGTIIGHILVTKLSIASGSERFGSLALAPVSVLPEFQGKGIGGKLILKAHEIARNLGFQSIVLLGHETYYPKFGYERASKYKIKLPFDVPDENAMVIALTENGLNGISGTVEYPAAFFG